MSLGKEQYIKHIDDSEQIRKMRQVLDKVEIVLRKHNKQYTDFLNPYERELAKSILNRFLKISYREFGGISQAERKIILICPDYFTHDNTDTSIRALEARWKFDKFSHRDLLGSILGLGINRDKVGDILVHGDYAHIIIKNEIADFILFNLKKVSNVKVDIKEIQLNELNLNRIVYREVHSTISSLRLDALISSAWNLSRKDSKKLIESGRSKVNWEPIKKTFQPIEEGDIISARGYGRFILDSIEGITRKGNIKIKLKLSK